MSQDHFIREIKSVTECSGANDPLSDEEITDLKGALGKLQWVASQTRPDLAFGVNSLTGTGENWEESRVRDTNKMIGRLHFNSDVTISFPKLGFKKQLLVYADASFQNLADGGSQGGYIVFLTDPETNMCHPLSWSSKRIRRVMKSTLAAETLALKDGLDDAFYIMELYQFILGKKIGITAITDSLSLYNAVYSSKVVEEKRLRNDISSIKELVC